MVIVVYFECYFLLAVDKIETFSFGLLRLVVDIIIHGV